MSKTSKSSAGLIGWVGRHRVPIALLLILAIASPAWASDDRQLMKQNSGANVNVMVILDSSTSMVDEFNDSFKLPAYMDDFIYPQGTGDSSGNDAQGSKFALAKSVLRQVITSSVGVNWAFTYYKNPTPVMGASWRQPCLPP